MIPLMESRERNECQPSNIPIEMTQQMLKQVEVEGKVDIVDK